MSDTYVRCAEILEEAASFVEVRKTCTQHLFRDPVGRLDQDAPDFSFDRVTECCTEGAVLAGISLRFGSKTSRFASPELAEEAARLDELIAELLRARLGGCHILWNDTRGPNATTVAKLFRDTACDALQKATVAA